MIKQVSITLLLSIALASFVAARIVAVSMKACRSVETLVESAAPQLKEIADVGASFGEPITEAACGEFSRQLAILEGTLKQTFRAATILAKKSLELRDIADIWKRTGQFFDLVLSTLASLKKKFPDCGTPELFDLALDYRRACEDRMRNVREEIECQTINLPKGLLPESS